MTHLAPALMAPIPAFQDGPRIGAVVTTARRHLPVAVIDAGSQDDTAAAAKRAGAVVLRQVPNASKAAALLGLPLSWVPMRIREFARVTRKARRIVRGDRV